MTTIKPVIRRLVVPTTAEHAFSLFTDEIGAWWPIGDVHSVFGAGATVAFRDGRLVETAPDGREAIWGTVLAWEPPDLLRFTWHPGRDDTVVTEVAITFTDIDRTIGHLTEIALVHSGWERLPDPDARTSYDTGWVFVLDQFLALTRRPHGLAAGR